MSTFISVVCLTAWHQGWTLSCFVPSFVEQQGVLHTHWILTSGSFLNHCLFPLFGNKLQTVQLLDWYLANQFIWTKTCFLLKMNVKSMPWFDFATLPELPPWSGSDSRGRVVLWSLFPSFSGSSFEDETNRDTQNCSLRLKCRRNELLRIDWSGSRKQQQRRQTDVTIPPHSLERMSRWFLELAKHHIPAQRAQHRQEIKHFSDDSTALSLWKMHLIISL